MNIALLAVDGKYPNLALMKISAYHKSVGDSVEWYNPNQIIPQWQKDMARWVNRKEIFQSTDFKDYQPRNGFYCREYF